MVNIKVKASLQLISRIKEIVFRCPKSYKLSARKDKDKNN